jgi:hypothetical protein
MNTKPDTSASWRNIIASEAGFTRGVVVVMVAVVVVVVVSYFAIRSYLTSSKPVDYADISEQFKYGSIGSDVSGLPYKLWTILPEVFQDKLPGRGYESLGFIREEGKPTPIGVSMRKGFISTVGLNCAVCHTGTVRESDAGKQMILVAGSAQQLDLGKYINFLFACAKDPRFTKDNLMAAMEKEEALGLIEKLVYPSVIEATKTALLQQAEGLSFMDSRPELGPGRVDTFNPYKVLFFHQDMKNDTSIGTAKFPVVWEQHLKAGLWLHWDGNNNSLDERNISAALGAGANPKTVDLERIERIKEWIIPLPKPDYPFAINESLAAAGEKIYQQNCANCHSPGAASFGAVTPITELMTDPHRVNAFTPELATLMNSLGTGYPWRFTHFKTTNGYANRPLDGIWARSPYLHNGSVPTLRDLLNVQDQRPKVFYKGYNVYDQRDLGFVSTVPEKDGRQFFKFDTALPGNANTGHLYGTQLSDRDKEALLEYLKHL